MTIIIFVICIIEFLILLYFCSKKLFKKYSGRLVIDEARDSWYVAITEDPEKMKNMKSIELKIEKI